MVVIIVSAYKVRGGGSNKQRTSLHISHILSYGCDNCECLQSKGGGSNKQRTSLHILSYGCDNCECLQSKGGGTWAINNALLFISPIFSLMVVIIVSAYKVRGGGSNKQRTSLHISHILSHGCDNCECLQSKGGGGAINNALLFIFSLMVVIIVSAYKVRGGGEQ